MSTKTTFKRIALVAVAALGLGVLTSVAPATATPTGDTITLTAASKTTTVGTETSTSVRIDQICFAQNEYNVVGAFPATYPAGSALAGTSVTLTAKADSVLEARIPAGLADANVVRNNNNVREVKVNCAAAGAHRAYATIAFTPDKAGTFTFTIKSVWSDGSYALGGTTTWTVVATANEPTAAATVITGFAAGTGAGTDADGIYAPKAATTSHVESVTVVMKNSLTADTLTIASTPALTATVTGAGVVSWASTGAAAGKSISQTSAQLSTQNSKTATLYVFGDGMSGKGTIEISYTNAAGTKTVLGSTALTFYGSVASVKSVAYKPIINGATTNAVYAMAYDADGTQVPAATLYATSDATTIVTQSYSACTWDAATWASWCDLTGSLLGTANITVGTGQYSTSTTNITAPAVAVRSGLGVHATSKITLSFDKTSYLPGESAVITVAVLDKNGLPVADGTYDLFTAATTASLAMAQGTLPGTAVTGGVTAGQVKIGSTSTTRGKGIATFTVNVPVTEGTVIVKGVNALDGLASTVVSASTVVENATVNAAIAAAADAAAEATDASNAATDAANAAAEAADAATAAAQDASDAVAALSTQVTTMIDALKKQITALTNLVIKIQKKVKA